MRENQFHSGINMSMATAEQLEDALSLLQEDLQDLKRTGQRWAEAELHRQRGELLLRRVPPDREAAEAAFRHGMSVAQRQGAKTFELRAALPFAHLLHATGCDETARSLLATVLAGFGNPSALPEVAKARLLLAELSEESVVSS